MHRFRNASAVWLVLALSMAAGAANAQSGDSAAAEENDRKLDTVTVTASKTGAQELQSVPLAIQAFSGEEMKARNITTVDDLVSTVPGASEGFRQSVSSRIYNLRGAVSSNGDSPIGYYLDDVPFVVPNFGIAPPVRFLDMERVEVLRGPHGTLYGQGSSGGVFIFHTRDPNLEKVEYSAEAEVSQTRGAGDMNYGLAGAVSVPIITDKLALRVSGGHSRNPGWADAYYGPFDGTPDEEDVNGSKNDDLRVVAMFKPADNVTLRAQYWNFQPRQDFTGFTASVKPPYFQNTAGQKGFSNGDFTLLSLAGTVDFDQFSITSATSHLEGDFGINIPLSPSGSFSSQFIPKLFSQELRANSNGTGPLHWLVGAAYQDGEGPQVNALTLPFGVINADNNTLTENFAVFGEVSYDLFDGKLVPLVGLRQYYDTRTFEDAASSLPTEEEVTTWRVNLSYLPTDDLTLFVSAATGFRPGIVQSRVQVQSLEDAGIPTDVALDPESSKNYEFGLKWRSRDLGLNFGLNLYQLEYTDLQTNTPGAIADVNGFTNFGDATTKGIDVEVRWDTPIEGLALGFVGNFNDSKYDTVNEIVQTALPLFRPGSRLVNTLDQNYRFDVNYNREITNDILGFGNIGFSHSGDRLQANGLTADPYDLISATVGVRFERYEVAFVGTNLGDERGPTFLGTNGPLSGSGPTPRTIGVRLRVLAD